ncbi:fimbrillin family protein [Bacteroides thetaiotaomicron]|uniref:fimbrillin family protein n=1 Tax=Bacteroides thetaiotaomicron TaxID=818 RepID=UPI00216616D7|nr:fimbrillin family protein [Bacteroides thetaiotaomicron]MCS2873389.1 fimbrillin family protein [Bacteroides thetaiotaomicron]
MRHSRIFRSSFEHMVCLFVGVAACTVSSCTDDTFDKYEQQGASGMLAFDVVAPGSWTNGSAAANPASKDISIRKITQSGGDAPLYLVTEIAEAAVDTAAHRVMTRGTTITGETIEKYSFGLSAICYTGDWPGEDEENKWTTNFAHNIEVNYAQNAWNLKEPLHWTGSGRIKFFAYSPYSAASGSSDNANSDTIIHSKPDATGVPTLTYTVPEDVTKQKDLLYAVADCGGDGTGDIQKGAVHLQFKHALTAVTIQTGKNMLAGKVTGITISGVHGKATCQIGTGNWIPDGDDPNSSFSIDYDEDVELGWNGDDLMTNPDIVLNKDEEGYTFMMIPQALTDKAILTISFTDSITEMNRTLTAKLEDFTRDKTWAAGKRYTYSVNSTGIVIKPFIEMTINKTLYPNGGYKGVDAITLKEDNLYTPMSDAEKLAYLPVSGFLNDVSITAYTHVVQAGAADETKEQFRKLDFKIEWSLNGTDWMSGGQDSHGNPMGWRPVATSQTVADNTDWTSPVSGSILLPAQKQFEYMQNFLYGTQTSVVDNYSAETATHAGQGTEEFPYDLVDNNDLAKESANCYIVNDHGYYTFPAYYGNTYSKTNPDNTSSYKFEGTVPDATKKYVLTEFVGYNNEKISSAPIAGVTDAILLWQDSPDLVTDVKYSNNKVSFRVPKETISQGNAVIAVRKDEKILWSWHIWVTHRKWGHDNCVKTSDTNTNKFGQPFYIAPCNLGYCEPHNGSDGGTVYMRFVALELAGCDGIGDDGVIEKITVKRDGLSINGQPAVTFTQPKIAKSTAGDNTYYQWGRKDAMLPGIQNEVSIENGLTDALLKAELTMVNKMFYSTDKYRFTSEESGKTIGESIEMPYKFFMHKRISEDKNSEDNFLRRHWHKGLDAPYKLKSIMNYWNIQLTTAARANFDYSLKDNPNYKTTPNDEYVVKTIYDPSPAGFKIPPVKAFADFFDDVTLTQVDAPTATNPNAKKTVGKANATEATAFTGWTVDLNGQTYYFPATGVRDMGIKAKEVGYGTFPSFSAITYIATSGFRENDTASSCMILSIDKRPTIAFPNCTEPIDGTNNAYGFTVRPIRDGQKGN